MARNDDQADKLAEALIRLGREELARRIRDQLDAQAVAALRSFVHPETGEDLALKGVDAAHPPRHETGSLTDK